MAKSSRVKNPTPRQEKNLDLAVTTNSMLTRMRQEGISLKDVQQETQRIGELFLKRNFRAASRARFSRTKETNNMSNLKREAVVMAVATTISVVSLKKQLMHQGFHKIIKVQDAEDAIMTYTGIKALDVWLKEQGSKKEHLLKVSGKKNIVEALLVLRLNAETAMLYEKPELLKKVVSQLFGWLKIVKSLEQQMKDRPQLAKLASGIGAELSLRWNQEWVCITLIIALTLEVDYVVFSMSHIKRFCSIIKETNQWKRSISQKLSSFFLEEGSNVSLADDLSMQETIEKLCKKEHQTTFFFHRKVLLAGNDDSSILKEAYKSMTMAVVYSFEGAYSADSKWRTDDIVEQVTSSLGNITAGAIYQFLIKYPYFLKWVPKEEYLRLLPLDSEGIIQRKTAVYGDISIIKDIRILMNKEVTIKDVVEAILSKKDFFGIKYNFFTKNRKIRTRKNDWLTNTDEQKIKSIILAKIVSSLSPKSFSDWLVSIEKERDTIDLSKVSIARIAATYISVPPKSRPSIVSTIMYEKGWSRYLDPEGLLFFKIRASTELKRFRPLMAKGEHSLYS